MADGNYRQAAPYLDAVQQILAHGAWPREKERIILEALELCLAREAHREAVTFRKFKDGLSKPAR